MKKLAVILLAAALLCGCRDTFLGPITKAEEMRDLTFGAAPD